LFGVWEALLVAVREVASSLLERERELVAIEALLAGVSEGRGGLLAVEG
jgi:hypothetical protein